jgi:lysophospholipase L1-like esterase
MTTISAPHTTALTTELRYLALGDSYTIGEAVDEAGRWPMQLARLLRMEGVLVGDPRIIATTGWLIGVNNQYRGRDVDEYRTQFAALLWRAIGFARNRPGRVLVLSIPDWGVTPFAAQSGRDARQIARELDAYNAAAREVCAQRGVAFVDITAVSRARGTEPAMLAGDGLHPSATMYTEWTRLAFPVAHHLLA